MLKLHYHPLSTFTRRVRIALLEKSLPHELVFVDMAKKAHRTPEYLALNPYGRVPTLDHDGFLLYESNAILAYLEAAFPEPALVPADPQGRALVDLHMRLCDLQLARHTSTIVFPMRFLPKERWDVAAMAAARAEIEKHLAILDRQLGERAWMVGDRYSLVEASYTPFLHFLPLMEVAPPPAVAAWAARMAARPSAQQTVPAN